MSKCKEKSALINVFPFSLKKTKRSSVGPIEFLHFNSWIFGSNFNFIVESSDTSQGFAAVDVGVTTLACGQPKCVHPTVEPLMSVCYEQPFIFPAYGSINRSLLSTGVAKTLK